MTPGQFLRLIWPDQGPYCIAHPFTPGENPYIHKTFQTVGEAVTHVAEILNTTDVYYTMLSLKQLRVWSDTKLDYKTGQPGAWEYRPAHNMAFAKCLFNDLDVGAEAGKYPTQNDALVDLANFLQKTGLPQPTLVSSGGGVHTYWHFDRSIPVGEWRPMAWHLRCLSEALKLKVDPTRTIDSTSILRVVGTFNWKKGECRPVEMKQQGAITPVETLKTLISDAMIKHGVPITDPPEKHVPRPAPAVDANGFAPQTFNDFVPPTLEEVGDACGQVREMIRSQTDRNHASYGPLDNTAWYRGMLATLKHVENGPDLCRKLTAIFPRDNSDVETKLHQLESFAPAKCDTLAQYMPWKDTPCQTCQYRGKVPNPIVAARRNAVAPPPNLTATGSSSPSPQAPMSDDSQTTSSTGSSGSIPPLPPGAGIQQLMAPSLYLAQAAIPNPPAPYERLMHGGLAVVSKDKDGNDHKRQFFPHDLFPLQRLVNVGEVKEQQVWRVVLPRSGAKDFTIDADALYDMRKFCTALANNGVYPATPELPTLRDYMTAYIKQLQQSIDATKQETHLGWTADHKQFVLPDKILCSDGTVIASTLALGAERASQFVRKKGDANRQRELLKFYDHPAYVPNQFVILASFASILFDLTGHHGIVVNCSGDPGASKSTTLYTAMGAWGDAILWPINGTNRGATANGRMQRMATNANLPTGVDEITNIPLKEAQDLVMGVTQPGARLRLTTEGVERKQEDNYKSSIMISTANSSLHSLISSDSAAGTAGSMRVFEIRFKAQRVHTKQQADEFLREMKENYGHLGEVFAHFVVQHRDRVAKRVAQVMVGIDEAGNITSAERFWSAVIAAVIVAGEICQALNITTYDPEAIRQWALIEQLPYMRGVVKDEYRSPLAVLTDYIAEKHGNIVVIDKATSIGANTTGQAVAGETAFAVNTPHGALLGHYDLKTQVLYMLKQGFKDYCTKIGASSSQMLLELTTPTADGKVVIDHNCRRTLGAGTNLAKGQVYCFAVDMSHPAIAGVIPTVVANSNVVPGVPTGDLKAV